MSEAIDIASAARMSLNTRTRRSPMNAAVSVYLDLARFMAAIVVAASHIWPVINPSQPLPWPAHEAVVVFFVLSGYVISYTVDTKETSFSIYLFNRLTRVWSVAIPALILGLLFSLILRRTPSDAFPLASDGDAVLSDVLFNLFFLGQNWTYAKLPPLNAPYWSLDYEVWYYLMFGAWCFVQPRLRWPLCTALLLIAGPKIALLFPSWLLGVVLYRHQAKVRMSERAALTLLAAVAFLTLCLWWMDYGTSIRAAIMDAWPPFSSMGASAKVVSDSLFAGAFGLSIIAVQNLAQCAKGLLRCAPIIRWGANRTLSIYLLHAPLFAFLWGGLELRGWSVVIFEAGGILLLAQATERQLGPIRQFLAGIRKR